MDIMETALGTALQGIVDTKNAFGKITGKLALADYEKYILTIGGSNRKS